MQGGALCPAATRSAGDKPPPYGMELNSSNHPL